MSTLFLSPEVKFLEKSQRKLGTSLKDRWVRPFRVKQPTEETAMPGCVT